MGPESATAHHSSFEDHLPSVSCLSPNETAELLAAKPVRFEFLECEKPGDWNYLFDHQKYRSEVFQRPYLYLSVLQDPTKQNVLDHCRYNDDPFDLQYLHDCLDVLLQNFSIKNPSWMELTHFASFLNTQLRSSENSIYCNHDLMGEDCPGIKSFVVRFLIQMSKDFASRSVEISDQSQSARPVIEERRRWENSPHPYIFFNEDGHSMSFFGFRIDPSTMNLLDERTNQVLEHQIMRKHLFYGLLENKVPFNQPFERKSSKEKLEELCRVFGVRNIPRNPDTTYELTTDNVMKMLAIFMRFRSNIPVVIMGETGSGKTRLIQYLCGLLAEEKGAENLLIMKTHGGITASNIHDKVHKAVERAKANKKLGIPLTVLFFDEANTTNAIGTIKEVMCDRLINGVPIPDNIGLQFVAAVNPYREHSEEMIRRLENAGLGYHIRADKTQDKLGSIPMRRLVYRVKELPPSLYPLVWDFGTLDAHTERKYISQMIDTRIGGKKLRSIDREPLLNVLCRSQSYMRERKDECSFVSLRDVQRMLTVLDWLRQPPNEEILVSKIVRQFRIEDKFTVSLILALGVSYYVRLDERRPDYANEMSNLLKLTGKTFTDVIVASQDMVINEVRLATNIAKNDALKENVWIKFACICLRIPLFLVGKPGSSKSLAKTVITDVMQGDTSYSEFFRRFMEIHMVSFQCRYLNIFLLLPVCMCPMTWSLRGFLKPRYQLCQMHLCCAQIIDTIPPALKLPFIK